MFDNKLAVLVGSIILCVIFWLVGGFVFKASFAGMICVIIGIAIVGLAVGNFMNSPCPSEETSKSS